MLQFSISIAIHLHRFQISNQMSTKANLADGYNSPIRTVQLQHEISSDTKRSICTGKRTRKPNLTIMPSTNTTFDNLDEQDWCHKNQLQKCTPISHLWSLLHPFTWMDHYSLNYKVLQLLRSLVEYRDTVLLVVVGIPRYSRYAFHTIRLDLPFEKPILIRSGAPCQRSNMRLLKTTPNHRKERNRSERKSVAWALTSDSHTNTKIPYYHQITSES